MVRDTIAKHAGESAEIAVLGREVRSRASFQVENAQLVHEWLGEYLRIIAEKSAELQTFSLVRSDQTEDGE